jgi:hypothetical protein
MIPGALNKAGKPIQIRFGAGAEFVATRDKKGI